MNEWNEWWFEKWKWKLNENKMKCQFYDMTFYEWNENIKIKWMTWKNDIKMRHKCDIKK